MSYYTERLRQIIKILASNKDFANNDVTEMENGENEVVCESQKLYTELNNVCLENLYAKLNEHQNINEDLNHIVGETNHELFYQENGHFDDINDSTENNTLSKKIDLNNDSNTETKTIDFIAETVVDNDNKKCTIESDTKLLECDYEIPILNGEKNGENLLKIDEVTPFQATDLKNNNYNAKTPLKNETSHDEDSLKCVNIADETIEEKIIEARDEKPMDVTDENEKKSDDVKKNVKIEALDENMITILVPQDMDIKNIKLEPEDSRMLPSATFNDKETIEISDGEDFYIIKVQESVYARTGKDLRYPRRNIHRPMNSGQLLVKCELCKYQTYDKSNLRKHKLIHTDLKPYSCELCAFTCKLPKYLKQHMITHMTLRLFPCYVCCHKCRSITELNRHIKRHLKLNKKNSVEELTEEEKSFCVCRDKCRPRNKILKIRNKMNALRRIQQSL